MADETIIQRYERLNDELRVNPDVAKYALPVLVAAEHLAEQMKSDTDRIIEALKTQK